MSRRATAAAVGIVVAGLGWPAAAGAQELPRIFVPNECVPQFKLAWGWCGDGGPANRALIQLPAQVTAWPDGGFAFSADGIAVIRKVDRHGIIDVVAGTGTPGFRGDGGPATRARISAFAGVAAAPGGGLLIADTFNHRVRHVGSDGVIRTVAGTGRAGAAGDGGLAPAARLDHPTSVDALPGGGFVIADEGNGRVRRVAPDGTIATLLVTGPAEGAGAPPIDVAALANGDVVVATGAQVKRVGPTGASTTVYSGDVRGVTRMPDGSAAVLEARSLRGLSPPRSIALGRCAHETTSVRIRTGDGGLAATAVMQANDVAALPDGSVLVSDRIFQRIRRIGPDGRVATVAGGGGLTGRVPQWTTCAGGGSSVAPAWGYFAIRRVNRRGRFVRVDIGTTLSADVRLVIKRGSRTVARRTRHVRSGRTTLRISGIRAGRYRFVLRGSHRRLRERHVLTKRVR